MSIEPCLVIVRGGGDLGTGVVYRLHRSGFPTLVLELEHPLVVRRRVAVATAVRAGKVGVEDLRAQLAGSVQEAEALLGEGIVPVLAAPALEPVMAQLDRPVCALVDARLAKRNVDTRIDQAPLVVALGPGFTAGVDCHAVIETQRGHTLGRVIWDGAALPNTGSPGVIGGKGAERVLRAPAAGVAYWQVDIGDMVQGGQPLGHVDGAEIRAPFAGVIRGLIAQGTAVSSGLKIGDVDARAERDACFTISDKALAIGGGVLEALLAYLTGQRSAKE